MCCPAAWLPSSLSVHSPLALIAQLEADAFSMADFCQSMADPYQSILPQQAWHIQTTTGSFSRWQASQALAGHKRSKSSCLEIKTKE